LPAQVDETHQVSSTFESICKRPACEIVDMGELSLHPCRSCQLQNDALLFLWPVRLGCKKYSPDAKASCAAEVHLSTAFRNGVGVCGHLRQVVRTDAAFMCWLCHGGPSLSPDRRSSRSRSPGGRDDGPVRPPQSPLVPALAATMGCAHLQLMKVCQTLSYCLIRTSKGYVRTSEIRKAFAF